jgi:hypothetical protein
MQRLFYRPLRRRIERLWLASLAALLALSLAGCQLLPGLQQPHSQLEFVFIGQQVLPHGYRYAGTTVGGLSGIDYDAATGRYWAISDDRSEFGPSRFYELALDLSQFSKTADPGHPGVTFHGVQTLKRLDGSTFADVRTNPGRAADPEAIRVHAPSGRLVWSSEGERIVKSGEPPVLVNPHVWEMQRDGTFLRPFVIPEKFHASAGNRGIRRNLAFEGLAFTPDYETLYVMTENALLQDGPAASLTESSPSRLLALDYASGQARAEYVIEVAPIPARPDKADGFADNGIPEILALDRERLLVLERSYVSGVGNTIKLFLVDLRGATDVSGFATLAGHRYAPAAKRLLLDFKTLGMRLDNTEGMTWGPRLPGGSRSLILVSDDNFNSRQITQFLAFEVRER